MGFFKIGNDLPRLCCDRHERVRVLASAAILIENKILIRQPAAAGAKSDLVPTTSLIWAPTRCRKLLEKGCSVLINRAVKA